MHEYRCYFDPYIGCFCAELYNKEGRFWQQVSYWYTSLGRLNRFFCRKHGFEFKNNKDHAFV